jgi:hypothetical protein
MPSKACASADFGLRPKDRLGCYSGLFPRRARRHVSRKGNIGESDRKRFGSRDERGIEFQRASEVGHGLLLAPLVELFPRMQPA